MTPAVPSWQRAVAWIALGGAVLLFLWPLLRGAEVYWPTYVRAIPIIAAFAVALLPALMPARLLRPEMGPLFVSLSRVALSVVVLLVIWEAIVIVTSRGF